MASPNPCPLVWRTRSLPAFWNGWKSRSILLAGTLDAAFAGRQGEQGVDEPFLELTQGERFLAGGPEGFGVNVGIGERDFEQGLKTGKGCAQLVGGVGDEVTLSLEGCFKTAKQIIEGMPQLCQLGTPLVSTSSAPSGGGYVRWECVRYASQASRSLALPADSDDEGSGAD
jgi:hypothetical protein